MKVKIQCSGCKASGFLDKANIPPSGKLKCPKCGGEITALENSDSPQPPEPKPRSLALIDCPDCGKSISKKAAACPGCGCPMKTDIAQPIAEEVVITPPAIQPNMQFKPTVIEATSKKWKGLQLFSALLIIVGVLVIIGGVSQTVPDQKITGIGGLLTFGGFVLFIYARFMAWWKHG